MATIVAATRVPALPFDVRLEILGYQLSKPSPVDIAAQLTIDRWGFKLICLYCTAVQSGWVMPYYLLNSHIACRSCGRNQDEKVPHLTSEGISSSSC